LGFTEPFWTDDIKYGRYLYKVDTDKLPGKFYQMSIRKANRDETKIILDHALDVFQEATVGKINVNYKKALYVHKEIHLNGGYYLVYSKKRTIMGWIGIGFSYDNITGEMIGFIPELYVLPSYRRKGIAKKLCLEAIRQIKEKGYNKVQLNVFSGNNAQILYKSLGFNDLYTTMVKEI
jgi:ribosomal protein S18 acetylase RimI-like enzyme